MPLSLLLSCQDRVDSLQPAVTASPPEYVPGSAGETYDPVLEDFARTLAASMADASMREFVKTEAAKSFDGDNDILVQQVVQQPVSSGTFEKMLERADGYRTDAKARKNTFAVSNYVKQQPLLNIAVPVHNDEWKTDSYEPLVAITPNVNDEYKVKLIKAFDSKGQIHWLDGRKSPDQPVVVVGLNERVQMDVTGQMKVKANLVSVATTSRHIIPKNLPALHVNETPDDGNGGGGDGGGTTTCLFQDNTVLKIPRIEVNNIEPFESWDRGLPEICLEAYGIRPSNNTERRFRRFIWLGQNNAYRQPGPWGGYGYSPYKSFDVNNLEIWDTSLYGNELAFKFWEEDSGGTSASSTLTVGPVSVTINLGAGDEEIGDLWLYRCGDGNISQDQGQYFKQLQSRNSNFWIFFQT